MVFEVSRGHDLLESLTPGEQDSIVETILRVVSPTGLELRCSLLQLHVIALKITRSLERFRRSAIGPTQMDKHSDGCSETPGVPLQLIVPSSTLSGPHAGFQPTEACGGFANDQPTLWI